MLLQVEPDPRFERDGFDVHSEVKISMIQAALGTSVTIPTLRGEEEVEIEAGTQPGDHVTLRGEGIPHLSGRGRRGDHYLHVRVEVPKKLEGEHEEALRKIAEELELEVNPPKKGLLGSLLGRGRNK